MTITEKNYKFKNTLSMRSRTDRIILHHAAASSCTADDIHEWHLANGWAGIGYHFFVDKIGRIYTGRPEMAIGAHASGANYDSIGICFEGNFEVEEMPVKQRLAGRQLVLYLMTKYNIPVNKVIKHKDVNATACPGRLFPFDLIVYGEIAENKVLTFQSAATADGFKFPKFGCDGVLGNETYGVMKNAVVKKRIFYRYKNLTEVVQRIVGAGVDGKCGKETDRFIREWQRVHGLIIDGAFGYNCWKAWFAE